jgi:hypothetical protein
MHSFIQILFTSLAVIIGAVIGLAFGYLQNAALRRHQKQVETGEFKSGWNVMPGSGGRVALLLMALVAIQFLCPILFADGTQWWVSGGLVAGYGCMLYRTFCEKRKANLI